MLTSIQRVTELRHPTPTTDISEFYLVEHKQLSLNNTELVLPDLVCGINTKITYLKRNP